MSKLRFVCLLTILALVAPPLAITSLADEAPKSESPARVERALRLQAASQDKVTFWVILDDEADLVSAHGIPDWNERGSEVVARLKGVAASSQARLMSLLRSMGADAEPFWIINAIQVSGDASLVDAVAAQPEVREILADRTFEIPEPTPGTAQATVDAIEWNIDRIRAPEVWSTLGIRGEGVVVANIDTGVEFNHPALAAQYRGKGRGHRIDHNYNWYDPSQICGVPSLVPCDNTGHGTHTMGTILGGGTEQIGVAPGAKWIAAKGCEYNWCSAAALLAAGQWILAPTDLNGQNPRPELRPNIVNNSWGGDGGGTWYQAMIQAWTASGIFPVFSNGNAGPGCWSAGSPGDNPESYSVGASDFYDQIASFSSRGPSPFGVTKPDIAAPGVDVRSSFPGSGYASLSGTSMAAPHVAGAVALMWSANPTLAGDIEGTRDLLDLSAVDTPDPSCGGTDGDNNVWGEGRLDSFVAAQVAQTRTGMLEGVVRGEPGGAPIGGAIVEVTGMITRTTIADPSGRFSFRLPVGTYDLAASSFGYFTGGPSGVSVTRDSTTLQDILLASLPRHTISGTVRDDLAQPVQGVLVLTGAPIAAVKTNAAGAYSVSVPEGSYDLTADPPGCLIGATQSVVVTSDVTVDFSLGRATDAHGYTCDVTSFDYIEAADVLALIGDDGVTDVTLPFPFELYGVSYDTAYVSTNGFVNFLEPNASFWNVPLPAPETPNAALYPFWDDLYVDYGVASVHTQTLGTEPNRRFVIEWRNVTFFWCSGEPGCPRVDFELILHENDDLVMQYRDIASIFPADGSAATIGIEDEAGSIALQYSAFEPVLYDGLAVMFHEPEGGRVRGTVTDAVDGLPIEGATVRALQAGGGSEVASTTTSFDGSYRLRLPPGGYEIQASALDHVTDSSGAAVGDDTSIDLDFTLRSARAEVAPGALELTLLPGEERTATLTLSNTGLADLEFVIREAEVAETAIGTVSGESSSAVAPVDYEALLAPVITAGGPVLVFMDALPWGSTALLDVLAANGVPYAATGSSQMPTIGLASYDAIFISSDQPQPFYDTFNANADRFAGYVSRGGFLWVGAAAWGWNDGRFNGGVLPGGATVVATFENCNTVTDSSHPTVQSLPDTFCGTSASHASFQDLPVGANVIARGLNTNLPTLVEYDHGQGRVLALGQTLEYGWPRGQHSGIILENGVPYAYAFEVDVPWISESPRSGFIAPGGSQAIEVQIGSTGLGVGYHRALLRIAVNDPRGEELTVPVTLLITDYRQGVNGGGSVYTDIDGDPWAADRRYATGGFGYTNKSASTAATTKPIAGTDNDGLYQSQRVNPTEYRFDGLPQGVYELDLRFAEVKQRAAGTRLFDVIVEGSVLLPAHDIAYEVGSLTADKHMFLVTVTDGQLNIRFVERRGFASPVVNAIRVTHIPDL